MITTNSLNYEIREQSFLQFKDTLKKVPTDPDAKKEYYVGCHSAEDWQYIHEVLMQDGTLEDNIPDHCCECCNDCRHAPRRGIYLLSDSEAEELKNHPRVRYVNINAARYPGTFMDNPDDIADATKVYRYSTKVKHQRDLWEQISTFDGYEWGIFPTSDDADKLPGSDLKNRGGYQLLRHMEQEDPWVGSGNTAATIFNNRIAQYGDGSDVDIIVCDQDMWFGHIEFQNHLGGPINYRGGNVLPGNGTCDLLDLILDAPYYLDPDFFNANPSKLMKRWDGTIVPTDLAAHEWWENDSTSHRSAKFVSSGNGGSATGDNDFGTLSIDGQYTRSSCNGSDRRRQTATGYHGTPCASQAYGRQYGWAYNANKWFLNLYGDNHNGWETGFDLQRIFHQIKPINPTYGTKDPTISSNSWSNRLSPSSSGYYWFRPSATDGTVAGIAYTSGTRPEFLDNFMGGRYNIVYDTDNSVIEAGEELCDSGVIFVHAAGNRNQKQVNSDHPDYNNYFASSNYTALEDAKSTNYTYTSMYGIQYSHAVNRKGFPGQIGIITSSSPYTYKTISVGALDSMSNQYSFDSDATTKERRTSYSNMGEAVDVFAAAHDTLAASDLYAQRVGFGGRAYHRYDHTYTTDGQISIKSYDNTFSGTSSACPIFVGLLATKMQYNRSWDYSDIRSWIVGLGTISSSNFHYGTESTTANAYNYSGYYFSMQGHPGYIAWDKPTGNEPNNAFELSISNHTPTEGDTVEIAVTTDAFDGIYYYTTDVGVASTISASDFDSNSLTGSFNVVSGIGTISLGIATDSTQELTKESFRIRVRTGTGIADTVLATSKYITIVDSDAPTVTFTTTPTSIDEGSTGTFEISAPSFSNGTNLYWDLNRPYDFESSITAGIITNGTVSTSSGIVTVSSGVGTINVIPVKDHTVEDESLYLRIRPQFGGSVLATSNNVIINDNTADPVFTWDSYPTHITVGTTATFTLRANGSDVEGLKIYMNWYKLIYQQDYDLLGTLPSYHTFTNNNPTMSFTISPNRLPQSVNDTFYGDGVGTPAHIWPGIHIVLDDDRIDYENQYTGHPGNIGPTNAIDNQKRIYFSPIPQQLDSVKFISGNGLTFNGSTRIVMK
jgi:hypothetical protein